MYDNNGNQTTGFVGLTMTYDAANRMIAVGGSQSAAYAYDSDNRRIYSRNASGSETIYFYGVDGKKLATYSYAIVSNSGTGNIPEIQLTQQSENVYFLAPQPYVACCRDTCSSRVKKATAATGAGME